MLELTDQRADDDLLREMPTYAAERIMEFGREAIDPGDRWQGE
ncbi:hypothetical protein [Poseidonocella sp. HB161398]